jgi:hypothetical protein
MILEYWKISIGIFIPLLIFVLGYFREQWLKKREEKRILKEKIFYIRFLLTDIRNYFAEYPEYLSVVSNTIAQNASRDVLIQFDSHAKGLVNRVLKLEPQEIHKGLRLHYDKSSYSEIYRQIYKEIDFLDDFTSSVILTVNNYQKSIKENKTEFRDKLYKLMSFNANIIVKLKSDTFDWDKEKFIDFMLETTENYLANQTNDNDFNYHFPNYLDPIFSEVRSKYRDKYFASDLIEKIKEMRVLNNDLKGIAELFSIQFYSFGMQLKDSITEIDKCINELNKNGL